MNDDDNYSLSMGTEVCCRILGIDPDAMLSSAGLTHLVQANGDVRVTAAQYFDAWNALVSLTDRRDFVTHLGITIARGPVIPVFFSLTCAPDLETGLKRLSLYKSLLGPTQVRSYWDKGLLWVEYHCADAKLEVPPTMGALHLVYSVEAVRLATAHPVRPAAATLHASKAERHAIAGHLGVMPERGEVSSLAYAAKDAKRPFISENGRLWADFEHDLKRQLQARSAGVSMSARVRSTLMELFAMGRSGAADVCRSLGVSRSTLQRALSAEGTTFQAVLDDTRKDLAVRYLSKSSLQIAEIASLLAYRDPNSFARGFRRWTGHSPLEFRAQC